MGNIATTNQDTPDKPDFNKIYDTFRFEDLKRIKPDPRNNLLARGWIKRGAAALLIGSTGIGKSVLAEQLACNLATGTPWLGRIEVAKPCKVLYIEAENDGEVLKEDILSIANFLDLDTKLLQKNLVMRYAPGLPEGMIGDFLEANLKEHKPDVVVIDPYQSFIGAADINSTEPFFRWREVVEQLIQGYNAGLLLSTHTPKPKSRDEMDSRAYTYLAAGTSAISNWTRSSCELLPVQGDDFRFTLHFSKQAGRIGLRDEEGRLQRNLMVEWSKKDGEPYWDLSEDQSPSMMLSKKKAVLAIAQDDPKMTQRGIAEKLNLSVSTVNRYYPKTAVKRSATKKVTVRKKKTTRKKGSGGVK